ncbi:MAG: hypothetical protein AMJ75_09190 [Phycisphaerae bacterium SM1_79]|jgi:hypothetical protein|nr:MAG: hypothetical protein AMJ75_09190 [Phycisphaerae bacterium SM1_79]
MTRWHLIIILSGSLVFTCLICLSCGKNAELVTATGEDPNVTTMGSIEVTARLMEIPDGAIFKRELYNYTTILKYEVLKIHRGRLDTNTIYVGHYNPFKPRSEAADKRVKGIGGNLKSFRAGRIHRMALEVPIDDYFMGGIINKYFGMFNESIYWAVWTNSVRKYP